MHTRDDVRRTSAPTAGASGDRLLDGLGRTTLTAVLALLGCLVLVVFGATVSMCWMVHPALSALATVGLAWLAARAAGRIFWTGARSR